MEIIKFALIAVVGVIIFVYLKSVNSELSAFSLCATGIILILTLLPYVINAINLFSNFGFEAGVSSELFSVVIKIIISYIFCNFNMIELLNWVMYNKLIAVIKKGLL